MRRPVGRAGKSVKESVDMNHKLPALAIFAALVIGILAFSPVGRGFSDAELGYVVQLGPGVFVAEVEDQVCASESPVHTTSSQTMATSDAEDGESMPSIYLVMLEDGVCASLSPNSHYGECRCRDRAR